jgi:peptide/nickel transport system substrate-binding protein
MRRCLRTLACGVLAILLSPALDGGKASATESYAIAMHGEPALPEDFTHMPYANPDAPKGGRLTWGVLGTFDSLNPMIVKGAVAVQEIRAYNFERGYTVESLMARGDDEPFTLYGLLARSVETDDARSFVTFHLDPRARFSDGQPVTADDVLFSWELLRDHGRPNSRQSFSKVTRAEALDPLSVRFDLAGANDRELPLILGLLPVLPRHATDVASFEETSMSPPVGSGPYRVTAVNPGVSVTFTRNPDYWGRDLPINRGFWNFDEIKFDFYRESNGLFEAFRRGLYDFRVETEPLYWHDGYDFPAARDGPGDPRHHQDRDAAALGVSGVQYTASVVLRCETSRGPDAAVRFRMGQPQLLLRTVWPLGGLLCRVRIVGLWPARRRRRAHVAETVRLPDSA